MCMRREYGAGLPREWCRLTVGMVPAPRLFGAGSVFVGGPAPAKMPLACVGCLFRGAGFGTFVEPAPYLGETCTKRVENLRQKGGEPAPMRRR